MQASDPFGAMVSAMVSLKTSIFYGDTRGISKAIETINRKGKNMEELIKSMEVAGAKLVSKVKEGPFWRLLFELDGIHIPLKIIAD